MNLKSFAACATALALLTSPALAADYLGGVVKSVDIGGKMVLTNADGMTLYTFDRDVQGQTSNCYDEGESKCATNWPPLLVPANTAVEGDFTLIDRKDSDMHIVAYKGWPLYLWVRDTAPGQTTGDGVGGVWHTAIE